MCARSIIRHFSQLLFLPPLLLSLSLSLLLCFFFFSRLQFEGEKFVDGLLGIGSAGGNSSTEEGKMLASRLETLRLERAKRTPVQVNKRTPVAAGSSAGGGDDDAGNFNHISPQGAAAPRNVGNKRSNRRKKGKKGKR
jgi:hypothetical protein